MQYYNYLLYFETIDKEKVDKHCSKVQKLWKILFNLF